LTTLDLSGNNLTAVNPCIAELKQLKELFLYENQLKSLPEELCKFPKTLRDTIFL